MHDYNFYHPKKYKVVVFTKCFVNLFSIGLNKVCKCFPHRVVFNSSRTEAHSFTPLHLSSNFPTDDCAQIPSTIHPISRLVIIAKVRYFHCYSLDWSYHSICRRLRDMVLLYRFSLGYSCLLHSLSFTGTPKFYFLIYLLIFLYNFSAWPVGPLN